MCLSDSHEDDAGSLLLNFTGGTSDGRLAIITTTIALSALRADAQRQTRVSLYARW